MPLLTELESVFIAHLQICRPAGAFCPERGSATVCDPQHVRTYWRAGIIQRFPGVRSCCDSQSRAPRQPQRGCDPKPKVAATRLPWVIFNKPSNRNAVSANLRSTVL